MVKVTENDMIRKTLNEWYGAPTPTPPQRSSHVFNTPGHSNDQNTCKLSPLNRHESHTTHIVYDLFKVYSNNATITLRVKKKNLKQ